MVIQPHQKLKPNHVANPKSVSLVHGANGPNATLNAINLVKCSVIVNAIAPMASPKKTKNVVATLLNAKHARVHHVHALAAGPNGLHAMASAVAANVPASVTIHASLISCQKLKKKCAKKNSVPQLNGQSGPNAMHHWADGDKNSVIAIVKAIVIAKIQTVVAVIWKSVKHARESQNVNGLDGSQPNLAVSHAVAVLNHVKEIAKKKCPIIFVIYQKILMKDVRVLSRKNLHVKLMLVHQNVNTLHGHVGQNAVQHVVVVKSHVTVSVIAPMDIRQIFAKTMVNAMENQEKKRIAIRT